MYKKIKYIAAVLILLTSISVRAQVTTQSPYSRYGLGNIKGSLLPQFRAMGGISTAVFKPGIFSNVNMQNPASYAGVTMTTLDMGASGGFTLLKNSNGTENSFNATLSHVAMAFPIVSGKSGISFGILPYSELGYDFAVPQTYSQTDTNSYNALYSGEGGLTKTYIGFGQRFGEHFRVGVNIEYLFGNLQQSQSIEMQTLPSLNARHQEKNSIGGFNYSYGAQYEIPVGNKKRITLGYSGSSSSTINSKRSNITTQYLLDQLGEESTAFDSVSVAENNSSKLKLPLTHNFGIAFQKDNKWLIGADYRTAKWSDLSIDGEKQGLNDSWGYSVGGQWTPDFGAVSNYFAHVDYRLGFKYDKTYIRVNNQDIKDKAITFGLGLPLANARYSMFKLNFTTEVGKRGSISNGLIQEKYVNFHIGFTLNDSWFTRIRLD